LVYGGHSLSRLPGDTKKKLKFDRWALFSPYSRLGGIAHGAKPLKTQPGATKKIGLVAGGYSSRQDVGQKKQKKGSISRYRGQTRSEKKEKTRKGERWGNGDQF